MSARYTKYHIQHTSAYTLIEILVGLSILGILFGFGFISFRSFSLRQQLAGTAKQMQGDLRLAQSFALAGEKPAPPNDAACNDPNILDSYSFNVYSANGYRIEANCGASAVVYKDVSIRSDLSITAPSPNPIKFKVLGQGTNIASGGTATITVTQSGTGTVATITISSVGEIK
jgi:prepilin-type N-terminal cleavage/methylation domain-containing protein